MKNNLLYVGAYTESSAKIYIADFDKKTFESITLPIKEKAMVWDIEFCNEALWVGGIANFEQVVTGSVVTYGDAFLWKFDTNTKQSIGNYYGTDRKDSFESISCGGSSSIFIGGIQDGPITHSGDHDPSLKYQKAISGRIEN